jgi:hypothetical protein
VRWLATGILLSLIERDLWLVLSRVA